MSDRKVMKLASREKRLGSFCIDAAVPVVVSIMGFTAIMMFAYAARYYNNGFGGYGFQDPFSDFGYGYGFGMNPKPAAGASVLLIISILLGLAYAVVQMVFFSHSKTIGKAALGLQVVSSENGEPIGFWKMLFREWFVKKASGYVFAIGYIWVLVDDKNRGWHDKILDTYVVDLKESEKLVRRRQQKTESAVKPDESVVPAVPVIPDIVPETATQAVAEPEVTPLVVSEDEITEPFADDKDFEIATGTEEVLDTVIDLSQEVAKIGEEAVRDASIEKDFPEKAETDEQNNDEQ